jgi:hypothetical protein
VSKFSRQESEELAAEKVKKQLDAKIQFKNIEKRYKTNEEIFKDGEFPVVDDLVSDSNRLSWHRATGVAFEDTPVTKRAAHSKFKGGKEIGANHKGLFPANVASPDDVSQGKLGDCWLLSALATLAEKPKRVENLFLKEVPLTTDACRFGAHQLRLYKDGVERIITIDDR